MFHTPSTLRNAIAEFSQSSQGAFLMKQPSGPDAVRDPSFMTPETQQAGGPRPDSAARASSAEDLSQTQPPMQNSSHAVENDKATGVAESMAHLSAPNNDDSAIDLDDDSMLMTVGKYGDMMASDPADAEGDVVVI